LSVPDRHHIVLGVFFGLATPLVASTATAAAKLLSEGLSPWFIVWVQYGVCSLVMLPWLLRRGVSALISRHTPLLMVRSLAGWLGFTTYFLALPHIPLVDATLLRAAAPLWVPLIVWLWERESIPRGRWIGLLGGFSGILLVLQPTLDGVSAGHLLGVVAGLSLATSMATTRRLSASEPAARVLFFYFTISFLASTPMGLIHAEPPTPDQIPGLLYVGLSIFLTMVLYTRAYTHAPTTVVAPLSYIAVPLSGLLDWWFWDTLPDPLALLGALVVIASGILAITLSAGTRSEH
jgi:drug/metabolite transporter (DMT)-like permease